jgi:ankyrin repeat protein
MEALDPDAWEIIPDLLSHGPDVSAEAGRSALLIAILRRRADTVSTLLAHGADPSAVLGAEGWTALRIARRDGGPLVVRLLKQAGATR